MFVRLRNGRHTPDACVCVRWRSSGARRALQGLETAA